MKWVSQIQILAEAFCIQLALMYLGKSMNPSCLCQAMGKMAEQTKPFSLVKATSTDIGCYIYMNECKFLCMKTCTYQHHIKSLIGIIKMQCVLYIPTNDIYYSHGVANLNNDFKNQISINSCHVIHL